MLVETLGSLSDPMATPILAAIVGDAGRAEAVRMAAIPRWHDRATLNHCEPAWPCCMTQTLRRPWSRGRCRTWPELASCLPTIWPRFWNIPSPSVRAAAILSLNVKTALPEYIQQSVLDRLMDQDAQVREAAMLAVVPLQLRAAIPRLIAVASDPTVAGPHGGDRGSLRNARSPGMASLSGRDRGPRSRLRRAGEAALLAIRDRVEDELRSTPRAAN